MGTCQTACCGPDGHNIDTHQAMAEQTHQQKPFGQTNLFELVIKDEKQLRTLEALINQGISTSQLCREISKDAQLTLSILAKPEKTVAEYEHLCLKDAELSFKAMEFSTLKYMGQVRMMPVYASSEGSNSVSGHGRFRGSQQGNDSVVDFDYTKCGYGKIIWPDGGQFEGYWINGQACGLGVFRAPPTDETPELYKGFWQQDRQTNLCVFRQNATYDFPLVSGKTVQDFYEKLLPVEEGQVCDKNDEQLIAEMQQFLQHHFNLTQVSEVDENELKERLGGPFERILPDRQIQNDLDAMESQSEITSQDKQNGKGIEVWSDGSYYHGFFRYGVKEGSGVYFWADGSKYTGYWVNDEMSGDGCFQWADGRYFKGSFKNGVMHGFGNYVWQDGRRYAGNYRYNKKHGDGAYTYSDGSCYRGEWVDGMQHGVGCIINAESNYERKGIWAFGKLKQWLSPDQFEQLQ